MLAHRLKKILPKIIGNEQKGFLKRRYTCENIRTVYGLMEYPETKNQDGMLLLLEFERIEGLKLTNVPLFNCALKLTWVKRLIQTKGNWQTIFGPNLIILNKKLK